MRAASEQLVRGSLVRTLHLALRYREGPKAGELKDAGRMVVLSPIDRACAMLPGG